MPIDVAHYIPRVIVKFKDQIIKSEVNVDQFLKELTSGDDWTQLKAQLGVQDIPIEPLFTAVSQARLLELIQIAMGRDPTYHPPNFLTYFSVLCAPPLKLNPKALSNALSSHRWQDKVKFAFVEGIPSVPQILDPGRNPDWATFGTGFLRSQPAGIDAENSSWKVAGGDGNVADLRFLDIESDWDLDHHDLPKLPDGTAAVQHVYGDRFYSSTGLPPDYFRDHGTAVLGIVVAQHNGSLSLGVTPYTRSIMVSSMWTSTTVGWIFNARNAILDAIDRLTFGDVLLLEVQITNYNLPVEYDRDNFDIIKLATALGIVIVEAAGNYWHDLDGVGAPWLRRNTNPDLDSGAIMVSAATPDDNGDATYVHAPRIDTVLGVQQRGHNYGSRIDCYAWSDNIRTTKILAADANGGGYFGDTSGASAIIAGAALSIQGMAEKSLGYRLSPLQMRNILSDPTTGTPSKDPTNDKLGVMPDLKAIVENTLDFFPDVYIRDNLLDTGTPHTGPLASSPDIILRPPPLLDPLIDQTVYAMDPADAIDQAFGPSSGTEDNVALSVQAQQGQPHVIYVRVRNRGTVATQNVRATVYYSEPALLVTPDQWNYIGSTVIANVPPGDVLTVSTSPIQWSAPGSGHYCFVALIGNVQDPEPPKPADFTQWPTKNAWDLYQRFIRVNNNVTWRNFDVVDNSPSSSGFIELDFLINGAWSEAVQMRLEVISRLPASTQMFLQVPEEDLKILHALRELGSSVMVKSDKIGRGRAIQLNPHGRSKTTEILFPTTKEFKSRCLLLVDIPMHLRKYMYEVSIRLLSKNQEVGRLTYRLAQQKPMKKKPTVTTSFMERLIALRRNLVGLRDRRS